MRYVTAASPEHYAEVLATAQSSPRLPWTDTTTPRTERPVRFFPSLTFHRELGFAVRHAIPSRIMHVAPWNL